MTVRERSQVWWGAETRSPGDKCCTALQGAALLTWEVPENLVREQEDFLKQAK